MSELLCTYCLLWHGYVNIMHASTGRGQPPLEVAPLSLRTTLVRARGGQPARDLTAAPPILFSLSLSWKRTTAFREQFLPVRATRMGQPIMALLPWGRGQPANDLSAAPLPCEPHLVGALARPVT